MSDIVQVEVGSGRGPSFADIARGLGSIGGQPVAPTDTDQQVIDKQVAGAKAQGRFASRGRIVMAGNAGNTMTDRYTSKPAIT